MAYSLTLAIITVALGGLLPSMACSKERHLPSGTIPGPMVCMFKASHTHVMNAASHSLHARCDHDLVICTKLSLRSNKASPAVTLQLFIGFIILSITTYLLTVNTFYPKPLLLEADEQLRLLSS